jgi:hypothetical protein
VQNSHSTEQTKITIRLNDVHCCTQELIIKSNRQQAQQPDELARQKTVHESTRDIHSTWTLVEPRATSQELDAQAEEKRILSLAHKRESDPGRRRLGRNLASLNRRPVAQAGTTAQPRKSKNPNRGGASREHAAQRSRNRADGSSNPRRGVERLQTGGGCGSEAEEDENR